MQHTDADLELALAATAAAASVVMRTFGTRMEVRHKAVDQPVTAADLDADALLRERLQGARPGYGWLSEETVDRPDRLVQERVWIVDPIDGTRSYIAGRPEFSISVGLAVRGRAVLGVVSNPATGELFWAVAGEGAYRRKAAAGDVRLAVVNAGSSATLLASRSEIAAGEFEPLRPSWTLLPTGSTAYKLAKVAAGEGSAFISRGPKSEWDVCAGALLVVEAGGVVTDLRGRSFSYNRPRPDLYGIIAGEPEAHRRLLQESGRLPPPDRLKERA